MDESFEEEGMRERESVMEGRRVERGKAGTSDRILLIRALVNTTGQDCHCMCSEGVRAWKRGRRAWGRGMRGWRRGTGRGCYGTRKSDEGLEKRHERMDGWMGGGRKGRDGMGMEVGKLNK